MGIYGKLTQLYQNAGIVSSQNGCGSAGNFEADNSGTDNCAGLTYEGAAWRVEMGNSNTTMSGAATVRDWSAFIVDQWVVSDVWDWHHRGDSDTAYDSDKERGFGIQQSYSGWFRDGDNVDWAISHTYDTGHGSTAGTVADNPTHLHPDP